MADKQVTVAVPEERVPEFYVWFAGFLAAERGGPLPWGPHGPRRGPGPRPRHAAAAWSAQDADQAAWLYGKLAPPARELLDLLVDAPGQRFSGNEIAARLRLQKGAHGVARGGSTVRRRAGVGRLRGGCGFGASGSVGAPTPAYRGARSPNGGRVPPARWACTTRRRRRAAGRPRAASA